MALTYNYAILQLVPFAYREEVFNVGIVVIKPASVDVRIKAPSQLASYFGIENTTLDWISAAIFERDEPDFSIPERLKAISSLAGIKFSEVGWFLAESDVQYEARIAQILQDYVDRPAVIKIRKKTTSVARNLKKIFLDYGLYGNRPDDINRHKVVPNMPVGPSGKLHVDFLLKNSAYHATETIDFRQNQEIGTSEIKSAALVNVTFQHAKDFLGDKTRCYLVFSADPLVENAMRPAIQIAQRDVTDSFNMESDADKSRYIDIMLTAAGTNGLPV